MYLLLAYKEVTVVSSGATVKVQIWKFPDGTTKCWDGYNFYPSECFEL